MRLLLLTSSILIFTVCSGQKSISPKLKRSFSGQTKDTLVLNHQRLVRTLRDNKLQSLVMLSGDTILRDAGYYSEVEFIDINADGYKDIRAFVVSNTPNQCENYLFDKKKKTFRFLKNCDLDIRLIKGTNYYYSYNRIGCAGMNWESYLSRIENFKLVPAGCIYGQGCNFDVKNNPQTIEIYKIINPDEETKILLKKLPYMKHIPKPEDKRNFIEAYWRKNWQTFKS
ncbi:MAG: hypothetical protein ACJ75B_22090 [Flavisolibacter sp.]